uniref:asparagine--tRNA ligase n=1 Tax=Kalanchoe fedtschenkoi TaxID=63787 RepID=A0A7N0TQ61_KALFE
MEGKVKGEGVPRALMPARYSKKVHLRSILCREDGGVGLVGEEVVIGGWVKSAKEIKKEHESVEPLKPGKMEMDFGVGKTGGKDVSCVEIFQGKIPFLKSLLRVFGGASEAVREHVVHKPPTPSLVMLQISDGSCVGSLQVLVDSSIIPPSQVMPTGTCILATGILKKPLLQGKYVIEMTVEKILHVGPVDENTYPLSKKRLQVDALREFCHIRPRTTTVASVMRIRNALSFATHTFLQNNGFLSVDTPIITTIDGERVSKRLRVTTLYEKVPKMEESTAGVAEDFSLDAVKAAIKEKSSLVEELKRTRSNEEALAAAFHDLKKTKELAAQLEAREKTKLGSMLKREEARNSEDFFSSESHLTVSGSLHLESYSCALGNVYSFGPRFQAHETESRKQVAEMWMVETELAFSDLEDAITCADDYLTHLCKTVLEKSAEDMTFVTKRIDKTIMDCLQAMTSASLEKLTYTQAVDLLNKIGDTKQQAQIKWGAALTEEHMSCLVDEIFKRPVVIFNYPKEVKPFYVRLNDDGKTVAAFQLAVPKIGTLISGSQKEERLDQLNARIRELRLPREKYDWYLDLRRHGTVQHSGFSFRFDLMVLLATGLHDVRDVIPFPRTQGRINY